MEKVKNKSEMIIIALALLPILVVIFMWSKLPIEVPMHFDINGKVNRYGSKLELFLVITLLNAMIYFLFKYLPKIDPKKKMNEKSLEILRMVVSVFICLISFLVLGSSFTQTVDIISQGLPIGMCVLMLLLGNYMPLFKPNYFIGIRTPWTLENEDVWKRTHIFFGKLWFWMGIIFLPLSLVVPGEYAIMGIVGGMLGSTVLAFYLSYKWYNEIKKA